MLDLRIGHQKIWTKMTNSWESTSLRTKNCHYFCQYLCFEVDHLRRSRLLLRYVSDLAQ